MQKPVVSIVTPFFNAKRWLPGLVATTREQTWTQFEHLLVDDCSTDDSVLLAEALTQGDPRYKVLRMPRNAGPAGARNLALGAAAGRYAAFLDADDRWLPEKLEKQIKFMQQYGHVLTFHDYRFISEDGCFVGNLVKGPDLLDVARHHTQRGVGCLTVMLDLEQIPGFAFTEFAQRALPEDHFAWLTVLRRGHVGHRLPADLGRYRVFRSSRSGNKFRAASAVWEAYRHGEDNTFLQAASWWVQYAWNAYRLHRHAKPRLPNPQMRENPYKSA